MNKLWRVAVVGAGAAGLAAARVLQAAGMAVTVFDKARRPGGRMAVRRSDWGPMHHGAPLLSLPERTLTPAIKHFLALAGDELSPVAAANLGGGSSAAFSYRSGLNALAARWAADLDIRCQHTLTGLQHDEDGWWPAFAEPVDAYAPYDYVILTAPGTQALALLAGLPDQDVLTAALAATRHDPCWSLLWVPAQPPACHGLVNTPDQAGGLAMILRETARDGDHGGIRYVVHATPAWSAAHLELPADVVAGKLVALAAAWLCCPPESLHASAHRWRYATVAKAAGQPCLAGRDGLWYAGDGCLGNTVIDALASGIAAAEAVLAAADDIGSAAA